VARCGVRAPRRGIIVAVGKRLRAALDVIEAERSVKMAASVILPYAPERRFFRRFGLGAFGGSGCVLWGDFVERLGEVTVNALVKIGSSSSGNRCVIFVTLLGLLRRAGRRLRPQVDLPLLLARRCLVVRLLNRAWLRGLLGRLRRLGRSLSEADEQRGQLREILW
jgi:hypothetical protein